MVVDQLKAHLLQIVAQVGELVVCEWARQHSLPQFYPVEGYFVALQELFHSHAAAVAHHILNVEHRLW